MKEKLKQLEILLFALLLLTLPLQTRILLSRFGAGEWMGAWLWASDVVLIALLAVFLIQRPKISTFAPLVISVLFIPSVIANIGPLVLWSFWKIIEGLLLFSYVKNRYKFILSKLWKTKWMVIAASGLVFSAFVGITQFVTQGDLGMRYLDESPLSIGGAGVAKFFVEGAKIIRAYGVTPHPNIFGALLAVGILLTFVIITTRASGKIGSRDIFSIFGLFLFVSALILTFSRSAWIALGVGLVVFLFLVIGLKQLRQEHFSRMYKSGIFVLTVIIFFAMGLSSFIFPRFTLDIATDQAITLRSFYAEQAVDIIYKEPLFGVGPGGFVDSLAINNPTAPQWKIQPVHNVALLLIAEMGLPAALLLIAIFITIITDGVQAIRRKINTHKSIALAFGLALISMFVIQSLGDHYLWTSQQGSLLLWLGLGVLSAQTLEGVVDQKFKY